MTSCGCSSSEWLVGTRPLVTFTFTGADRVTPIDPTAIAIRVMDPAGTVTPYTEASPEVANPAVGTWTWQPGVALITPGTWWVYVAGAGGGGDAASQGSFQLGDTHVPLS